MFLPLQLVKSLPAGLPRGFALQQRAAALVLQRHIPGSAPAPAKSKPAGRGGKARGGGAAASASAALDPVSVISALPWSVVRWWPQPGAGPCCGSVACHSVPAEACHAVA